MALKNTLLLCGVIVAGGAIAGISMQPHSYYPQRFDSGSGAYNNAPSPSAEPASSYNSPSHGSAPQGDAPSEPNGAPPSYDQPQGYGGGDQQQPYGQQQPAYGQQPQQQDGQPAAYGPPQRLPYGSRGAYGPPSRDTPNDAQLVSLTQLDHADRILPRMPVESANGQRIGEVAQVTMRNGRASEVLLDQGTRIPASDLMYSPSRSVLVAQGSPSGNESGANGYGPPERRPSSY
jgi:hypothetical protein